MRLLSFLATLLPLVVSAQQRDMSVAPDSVCRGALVIGNGEYANPASKLQNAVNDADDLAAELRPSATATPSRRREPAPPATRTEVATARPPSPSPPAQTGRGPRAGDVVTNEKDGLRYVWIPPGSFEMGCSPGDNDCD
jgi:hypothetical protein